MILKNGNTRVVPLPGRSARTLPRPRGAFGRCAAALLLTTAVAAQPRPTRDGLLLPAASFGRIVERDSGPARCHVAGVLSGTYADVEVVPAVIVYGACEEYPDPQPQPGHLAALNAGTMTVAQFMAANPGVGLCFHTSPAKNQYGWTNERRECLLGHHPPPIHVATPAQVLSFNRIEFWAGACEGAEVLVECADGAAFSWEYIDGNRQFAACGTALNALHEGNTPGYGPCDADFDGDGDVVDLGLFVQAGGWDWNRDGLNNAADLNDFAECVR